MADKGKNSKKLEVHTVRSVGAIPVFFALPLRDRQEDGLEA